MIYQSQTLQVTEIHNGILQLNFCSQQSVNKLDQQTLCDLDRALDTIAANPTLSALMLTSDKDSFIVGADINEFIQLFSLPREQLDHQIEFANTIFCKLEDLPVPTLSVLSGHTLGGGCECVLATDYRIGDNTTSIGLPETKLGIIPGFGGTVRLPRLIGADSAMELITQGKICSATQALKYGLLDALVDTEQLHQSALKTLNQAISNRLSWQQRRQHKLAPLALHPIEAQLSFASAKGMVALKAGPHYPAPLIAIKAIEEAAQSKRAQALDIEKQHFLNLAQSDTAHALIRIFLNEQYIKSLTKTDQLSEPVNHSAILGAGIMGGGIACQAASKGMHVFMKDIARQSLDSGMQEAIRLLGTQVQRGKISSQQMAETVSAITPTLNYSGIEECSIVIEAVVENPQIKSQVLAEAESHINPDTIMASNTSTIPITELAKALQRPENFCGMHFFNPVHKMPLVEVIRAEKTCEQTISSVVACARQMGKLPIVVNDCAGFFVNRVLFPYFTAFNLLIRDGADFTFIDKVMQEKFGWPMGPAYLLDVVGLDTAVHAQKVMAQAYPQRMASDTDNVINSLVKAQRFGQKNGHGFYTYQPDKTGKLQKLNDADITSIIAATSNTGKEFSEQEVIERLMIPMINETILCLQEGIINTAQEADTALVYGLGFPPFRGGICCYLQQLGINNYIAMSKPYAELSPLYHVPELLMQMVASNATFYATDTGESQ